MVSALEFANSGSASSVMDIARRLQPHARQCSRTRGRQQRTSSSSNAAVRLKGKLVISRTYRENPGASHIGPSAPAFFEGEPLPLNSWLIAAFAFGICEVGPPSSINVGVSEGMGWKPGVNAPEGTLVPQPMAVNEH